MNVSKIALALSKAQSNIHGAIKDSKNPHFNSSFATLESIMDAIREPFAQNELSVVQPTVWIDNKLFIKTMILHSSGELIEGLYPVITKDWNNPQAVGSGMSYARRYSLSAMVSLPQVDDDGNSATDIKESKEPKSKPVGYVVKVGKFKDRSLNAIDKLQLQDYLTWLHNSASEKGKPLSGDWLEFAKKAEVYLTEGL